MNQEIIFISDLHLSLEKKDITRRFLAFLHDRAIMAQTVYILGDLFDAWIGDDDNTPPNKEVKNHLKQLVDSGTQVYLQLGNRDFLLGQKFAAQTGVRLLGEYEVIDLFGVPTLLTHGDLLCSDDVAYQQFREKSRRPEWMQNVLSKPLFVRLLAARWYRFRSHFHKRRKSRDIMDVNQQTVIDVMRAFHCRQLIHGHTHRPAVHDLMVDGQPARRFVLAEWKKKSVEILSWTDAGYSIETLA